MPPWLDIEQLDPDAVLRRQCEDILHGIAMVRAGAHALLVDAAAFYKRQNAVSWATQDAVALYVSSLNAGAVGSEVQDGLSTLLGVAIGWTHIHNALHDLMDLLNPDDGLAHVTAEAS